MKIKNSNSQSLNLLLSAPLHVREARRKPGKNHPTNQQRQVLHDGAIINSS
ncbi:MAG: hypothetical protein KME23_22300 [Goleter apudmare HA4340-LM2]|nr:hypothetical protein [Goleter apudmare HA4340-LM2]